MSKTEQLFGTVNYQPSIKACYVRVSVPGHDGIPLALKATFSGFDHRALKQGTYVMVTRSDPNDCRHYAVTAILTAAITRACKVDRRDTDGEACTGEKYLKFFMAPRYFGGNGSSRQGVSQFDMAGIMHQAFGVACEISRNMMENHPSGFHVVCRREQFADFIVHRMNVNSHVINGIRDLKPMLTSGNLYDHLAEVTGVNRHDVKQVVTAMGYSNTSRPKGLGCDKIMDVR